MGSFFKSPFWLTKRGVSIGDRGELPFPVGKVIVWASFCAGLILADVFGWLRWVRNPVELGLVPLESSAYQLRILWFDAFSTLTFWRSGAARVADLERQVAELSVEAAKARQLSQENEALRKMLGASIPPGWRYLPAPLIGKGEELSLGIGRREGVAESDAVVWEDILLGEVSVVSERQSQVRFLTDPRSRVPVSIPAATADGLLVGRFATQMVVTQVLQGKELLPGMTVVTGGALGLPRGLVVGKIERVISVTTDLSQEAVVAPVVDLQSLGTVFVLKEE